MEKVFIKFSHLFSTIAIERKLFYEGRKLVMAGLRKHTQNVIIDMVSFVCMVILFVTGAVLHYRLPHGSHNATLLGQSRHEWADFHFWVALIFVAGIIVHMVLHIPWIKSVLTPKDEKQRKYTALWFSFTLYALILFSLSLLVTPIAR